MPDRLGVGAHDLAPPGSRPPSACRAPLGASVEPTAHSLLRDDVVDRDAGLRLQPLDQVATQPAGARGREGRDDDLVDALVVRGLHRRGEGVGMNDLAMRVDPLRAQLRERAPHAPGRLGARGSSLSCGETMRKLAGPLAARSRIRSRSSFEMTVSFATTSTLRSSSTGSSSPATTCLTGMPFAAFVMSPMTSRRSQPERCAGCVETTISSGGGSS